MEAERAQKAEELVNAKTCVRFVDPDLKLLDLVLAHVVLEQLKDFAQVLCLHLRVGFARLRGARCKVEVVKNLLYLCLLVILQ